ncbi:putative sporulation protein YtxC [Petroclostridium sp. X23]|uniref:putative sporulation protein YtxC n=1 Tax=Petroclostridium sp. X23 TaxID=3045146 RepID=UPI0024AC9EF6|nr:putative sporulation protein YtxC [Petroclostridium sp. X23]WHH59298.1 putative sporulation protein YtxC [Petroclostridium sp. X23]
MDCLYIGMTDDIDDVKDMITDELDNWKEKNINIELKEKKTDDVNFIELEIHSDDMLNNIKVHLANTLSQYIIEKYEQKFISRIISSNYCYFNTCERREILKTALKSVLGMEEKNIFSNLFMLRRKNIVVKKLLEYLETSNEIILDGFVTFRLKDYIKELEDVVDKAVDDYLMEKEYKEFIRLLKYFVEIQEPKFDVVHVLASYDNKYVLMDNNRKEITNECIQDFINEVADGEINYDDLLVSSLITLAPNKIHIHMAGQIKNRELMETIKNVFYGKVIFCPGCDLCMVNKIHPSEIKMTDYLHQ